VPHCKQVRRWLRKEATSNQRGTRVPTLSGGTPSPLLYCSRQTNLFAWYNLDYPPMVTSGQDNGSSQFSSSSSTGNIPSNTTPPYGSDDPSRSGPPAVPPIDDVWNREGHHPPYASTGVDGKAPLGEHLAVSVVVSRQPS
jgi:hypothetical protein